MARSEKRSLGASLALHAGLGGAALIAVFPVLWVFLTSLKPAGRETSSAFFDHPSFAAYGELLSKTKFLTWFGNTVLIAGFTTVLGVFLAATTGYAVSRFRFPGMRPLMWTLLVTQMFPVAILIVPIYQLLGKFHLLNQPLGLILTYMTISVPFCAWTMKGYFDTISSEIDEAGRIDGLNPFGTFWRLILPLARPGLAVTAFYSFITAWGEVAYASQFMTGLDKMTLAGGLQTFVNQYTQNWSMMSTASVLIAIPAAVVFVLVQRHLVAGQTAGSIK
ncbi:MULTISPECIES: sugar ABC transporter permease [Kitasatospora]|uniref:Arabinogalactan oligomer/maltooligosaccharide transport system permease protein n=2 Tax=Kitasatospora TaxID=2063 RepID=A0ABT1J5C5_9ACTN|nr:carbohydrate ABC transporter permease [Kitasatospora paracochleata]MCP2312313.1 arabinogalactan oligomer/maltooligosaccharide transport system permease protein [Kitasatospora paracochleata]